MLPNAHLSVIHPAKVRDYLLSPSHPVGRFKSVVFAALGYTQENWRRLSDDLLALAQSGEAEAGQASPYGLKYEVNGKLIGPAGRTGLFVTVWLMKHGEVAPRFVTAHPE